MPYLLLGHLPDDRVDGIELDDRVELIDRAQPLEVQERFNRVLEALRVAILRRIEDSRKDRSHQLRLEIKVAARDSFPNLGSVDQTLSPERIAPAHGCVDCQKWPACKRQPYHRNHVEPVEALILNRRSVPVFA